MNTEITKGTKANHPRHGLVRVVAVRQHDEGFMVARVVDACMVSDRGGIWVRLTDLTTIN